MSLVCTQSSEPSANGGLDQKSLDAPFREPTSATSRRLGQQSSDRTQLERALAIFERCAAVPYAARVRTELGRLTGNEGMVAAGIRALEALGDVDQIDRYRPPAR